ncbi:hypothetical protein PR002_g24037 [Phytophthora rubi]|uniref:Uncharacterized protein n=1 Tax=Phytophthora rubi TaxID=129364 RepID=A0A6A3IJI6_9STRA|nr:hypothetical protein PR002_g24037 [Phytophthora rubi]
MRLSQSQEAHDLHRRIRSALRQDLGIDRAGATFRKITARGAPLLMANNPPSPISATWGTFAGVRSAEYDIIVCSGVDSEVDEDSLYGTNIAKVASSQIHRDYKHRSHAGEERTPVDGIGRRSQRRLRSGPGILWKSSGREVDGSNTPHSSAGEGSDAREEDASKDNSDGVNEIQTVEKVPSDGEGDESQRSADMSGGNVGNEDGVAVDPPEQWHDSWKAWQTYLAEYCARTMQILPVKETMSRSERNRRLQKTKKGSAAMLPDGCDPYQRTYTCTHGWLKRKSRSDGGRPRQHIRLTNCPFRFIVQWDVSRLQLRVKNGCFLHNHPVSKAAYKTNPSSRGVKNPLIEARVEGMQAVGARRSRIYDYLLAHDQNVIQSDVDNMVREHASSVATVDDNETTAQEVALFPAADPENRTCDGCTADSVSFCSWTVVIRLTATTTSS